MKRNIPSCIGFDCTIFGSEPPWQSRSNPLRRQQQIPQSLSLVRRSSGWVQPDQNHHPRGRRENAGRELLLQADSGDS